MNKILAIIGIVFVVIGGIYFFLRNEIQNSPSLNSVQVVHSELNENNNEEMYMEDIPDQTSEVLIDLTSESEVLMNIKDFKYEKPNIKIRKGTKVTWVNQDTIKHNVMLEHDDSEVPHDPPAVSEIDSNEFAGPMLAKGESYSFIFNEVSINPYHCSPHPQMKGRVIVE